MATNWVSLPGGQTLFLQCPVFEALNEGPRGAAKTDGLLMDFSQHTGCGFGENWRGILFRQTYKQLSDIVAKTRRWFPSIFPGARFNAGTYTWRWPTGEELLLRQAKKPEDYWDYHGHEYPWIGWEELTNWPTSELYESMMTCSRSSIPGMPRKVRATANPFGVGHNWVKRRFIDVGPRGRPYRDKAGAPERVSIHSDVRDNIPLLTADPEYLPKLEAITSLAKRLAWLYGDWDITAGGMFDDVWDADTHLVEPFDVPPGWHINRAFDWGSSKPFSYGLWAISDGSPLHRPIMVNGEPRRYFPSGTLFRLNEWYGWSGEDNVGLRMVASDIAAGIVEREREWNYGHVYPGPADASVYDVVNGVCIGQELADGGAPFVPSQKGRGSRINGWELLRTRLHACSDGEDPGLYVVNHCEQFKRTFPYLPRDEVKMDDVDTDAEDHTGDEARYEAQHVESKAYMESMY